jgi:hypothetical protein
MKNLRVRSAAFALVLVPFLGFSSSAKLAPDLSQIDPQSRVDVIIQFAMPPGDQQHASILQRGGLLKTNLDLVQAAVYSIPAVALEALASNPAIVYISPDRDVAPALDYANATVGAPIALQYGWDGTGVGIAVIDSGITDGRDFLDKKNSASNASRIVHNQSSFRLPQCQTCTATALTSPASWRAMEPIPPVPTTSRHFAELPLMPS